MKMSDPWRRDTAAKGLAALVGMAGCVDPGLDTLRAGEARRVRDAFFERPQIVHLEIEIQEPDMAALRSYRWQWNAETAPPRPKVAVTVREGGDTYHDVSLHLKGAAGSFRPVDDRPAMTLNFDRLVPGQKFHGMDKLSLNNSVQDPTLCNERLARQLFAENGVPTPRASHARVRLNGRDLGMYVLVEGFNKRFLRDRFGHDEGTLFDGGFVQDVDGRIRPDTDSDAETEAALARLNELSAGTLSEEEGAALAGLLDSERFVTHAALDVMLWNWDGYHLNRNNFRLHYDSERGQFTFMPHGLDQLFEQPEGPVFPFFQGKVTRSLFSRRDWYWAYFEHIQDLFEGSFQADLLSERVDRISEVIRADLALNEPDRVAPYLESVEELKDRIRRRCQTLAETLNGPSRLPDFDSGDEIQLTDWEPDPFFGKPTLEASMEGDINVLALGTASGTSIGRWGTTVWLEAGEYQLVGSLKLDSVTAVPGDRRGGVALGSSVERIRQRESGSHDWQEVALEFRVRQPIQQVQLYCEFRAREGTAWLNADSLRLRQTEDSLP